MGGLFLTLACGDYDRLRPLWDGSVVPEGIELNVIRLSPEEIFFRQLRYQEFDASELSLSSYTISRSGGSCPFIAIPVFPSRFFRHSCVYVNAAAGIHSPKDLRERRVGVPDYQMTAAVWVRAFLQHDYGVPPEEIQWVMGGQETPGRTPVMPVALPNSLRIEPLGPGQTLSSMLERGEIAALITPYLPSPFVAKSPKVRRLFPNFREVEEDYFRRTGVFPIMHTLALKEEFYRRHPWVAQSLYKACVAAKALAYQRLHETNALHTTLAWLTEEVEREEALTGEDFWPYGLLPNRPTLEAFTRVMLEQGLVPRKLDAAELFAPNTLASFKR